MTSTKTRTRNPRGEGGRLREEIVQAAVQLIDEAGLGAVTLRAVARSAGISAPSIYNHFADREQILDAVSDACFKQLGGAIAAARDPESDPVARLQAGCHAYLSYAEQFPQRYGLLFRPTPTPSLADGLPSAGAAAFGSLVDAITECVAAGRSASNDPFIDAVALWSGLHGFASLTTTQTGFPWPDRDIVVRRIILSQARITDGR